jgi:hypothetical protein
LGKGIHRMTPISLPATTWRSVRSALAYQRARLLRKAERTSDVYTATHDRARAARFNEAVAAIDGALDPREPDTTRKGIFRDHNCYRCHSGELPCATVGGPLNCEFPHARND